MMNHSIKLRVTSPLLRLIGQGIAALMLIAGVGCATETNDQIELRRGETVDGYVVSYAADVLTFKMAGDNRNYTRAETVAIIFDLKRPGPKITPSEIGNLDRIILRSGELRLARLESIDSDSVVTSGEHLDRKDVYRIELSRRPSVAGGATDKPPEEEEPQAACWQGVFHVRDRFRRPATPEVQAGRKCPASIETWNGSVNVILTEQFAGGVNEPPSGEVSLRYREMACRVSTPGWGRVCEVPETYGPGLLDRHRYEFGFKVLAAEHFNRLNKDQAENQPGGFYFFKVEDTPLGVWPDAKKHGWKPGQYLLRLPYCGGSPHDFPLEIKKWHKAIRETPTWPTIRQYLSPMFSHPLTEVSITPGYSKATKFEINAWACEDKPRFVDDGHVMKGENTCRFFHSGGQIQILETAWELERVDCEDAKLPEPPKEWKWPEDSGIDEEWKRPEGVVLPLPRNE